MKTLLFLINIVFTIVWIVVITRAIFDPFVDKLSLFIMTGMLSHSLMNLVSSYKNLNL